MIKLPYSLVIEATAEDDYFGFFSTELEGFSGIGHSIEDCMYKARLGMDDHIRTMRDMKLDVPDINPNPTVLIQNQEAVVTPR